VKRSTRLELWRTIQRRTRDDDDDEPHGDVTSAAYRGTRERERERERERGGGGEIEIEKMEQQNATTGREGE
jgi:hypothetical protein